jgi:hypothetical protein
VFGTKVRQSCDENGQTHSMLSLHDIISCLAVGGRWVTCCSQLQVLAVLVYITCSVQYLSRFMSSSVACLLNF